MKASSFPDAESGGFSFSPENDTRAKAIVGRYPEGRQASAVLALLDLAQRQNDGWLSGEAIEYVADYLDIAPIRAHEVATFYSMFNLEPVGKYFIQVCRTTPCWLCGSDDLTQLCRDKLGIEKGGTTEDGLFTLVEVECLGACANAPMVQINDDYYEDLNAERLAEILDALKAGREVKVGSQSGRQSSAPDGGPKTLVDVAPAGGDA
ncbi:MAG: NADH-quinone oxidoreductase subunit NuoE [Kiloniellales bacterium]|nr:NADH-quinone oxidoreductase subunit NuoE [Kiloniellales bacterium]